MAVACHVNVSLLQYDMSFCPRSMRGLVCETREPSMRLSAYQANSKLLRTVIVPILLLVGVSVVVTRSAYAVADSCVFINNDIIH